ncbi:DUF2637 domain-containing protein [Streptomyces sp. NBC_01142]|uniref:DUF2637 domain-containing protein n=1 Tax=Streptomyces sp. NBC_01142 TaxID=2975865 RepID=UPI00224F1EE1|nr:DUF2637 domain-containing protein [Streptomyces sp. NBC_01142]MCX4818554.1 DUF2637 domain-containing protein [Streptomyces sp. NBC_01142]
MTGRAAWGDPYLSSPEDSLGGYQTIAPLAPSALDESWDPALELQQLLQTAEGHEFGTVAADPDDDTLARSNRTTAPVAPPPVYRGHRRQARAPKAGVTLMQTTSIFLAALGAVIVSMVSVFGGMVALDPLRRIAAPHIAQGLVSWWPLLVYGPWLVASLAILRASLHQRRVVHSWFVVLVFSTLTTLLCVAQAPRTITGTAAAALPSLAALACFQQLVRQITLTRPPRQAAARHRTASPSSARRSSHEQAEKGARTQSSPLSSPRVVPQERAPLRNAGPRQ